MNRDRRQILTEYRVVGAQRGDARSFRDLYELWHPELMRYARVRLHDTTAAEEVMQEAWEHIARGLGKLDDPACFPRWAFQIVFRRSADWIRREQRSRRQRETLEAEADSLAPEAYPGVAQQDERDSLHRALASLPASEREILHLFYLSGLEIAAISEVLEVPKGTVKSRLFYAREHLRDAMQSEF